MGNRLQVQTGVLLAAGRSLRAVYGELDGARDTAEVDRDVIAHDGLRDRVHDFGSGWDAARTSLTTAIEGLGTAAEKAAEVYERIESELVGALAGER